MRSLEIREDLAFQRRAWVVQRVAWVLMLLAVVAAAAGLTGSGPLSTAEAASGGVRLEYDRFARRGAMTQLRVRFTPNSLGSARISIDRGYAERVRITSISPSPAATQVSADTLMFAFRTGAGSGEAAVTFHIQPRSAGRLNGRIRLEAGPEVAFTQFVYP